MSSSKPTPANLEEVVDETTSNETLEDVKDTTTDETLDDVKDLTTDSTLTDVTTTDSTLSDVTVVLKNKRTKRPASTFDQVNIDIESLKVKIAKEVLDRRALFTTLRLRVNTGVKFLTSMGKSLKDLQAQVNRLPGHKKQRRSTGRKVFSGIMRPQCVTKEVCDFAGWKYDELHSRVDITKVICNYVKAHSLQDPKNGRIIVPDKTLTTLLRYDKTLHGVLFYHTISKLIGTHVKGMPVLTAVTE
jgi:hypothetical protein